ncbi:efflux RND transporter permease subunit [Haloarchaeobius salinus]|uniref:efflux RND transporter permease subunit n=1 Tax=Haloarchaeobius salinus TaxID=1198298 RepID=UPI00210A1647|nr:efflux RND transporter permease subunit [Haloarchaeobius salinus]
MLGLDRVVRTVTDHNRIVLLVMLLACAGVIGGITQLEGGGAASTDSDAFGDTTVAEKADYIETYYGGLDRSSNVTHASVYVRETDGNVLTKESLLASLEYQRSIRANDSVADALAGEQPVVGVSNVVAMRAAGDRDASLDAQLAALEAASSEDVRAIVSSSFTEGAPALRLLPQDYEPGSTTAESRRMVFTMETAPGANSFGPPADAQRALYEGTQGRPDASAEYFTLGQHAQSSYQSQVWADTTELILPAALLLILAVLGFAYRDLVDVVVGFFGVVVSVLCMFGILGWLGIPAGVTMIIGPVLITGLSIDYGLHVFMRYREQRGEDEGIREPMYRSLSAVSVALLLVTVTTAVGFLSNLTSPIGSIRQLGIGITLGVVSAFVVFTTLVPALKVSIDGLLERVGLDRRKAPLGQGRYLEPLLTAGVRAARVAAPVVVVVAVLAGAGGAAAWSDLDRQGYQTSEEVADWKEDLPGPLAWEATQTEWYQNNDYVAAQYQAESESQRYTSILVEGEVATVAALERVDAATADAAERDVVFSRDGTAPVVSPLSVMERVAAQDEAFASVLADADTDGDGVPDRNVAGVYEALYEANPEQASRVVERTDGDFRTVRMLVPVEQGLQVDDRANAMHGVAGVVEAESDLTATAVGQATFSNAELGQMADGIVETMVIALVIIAVVLALVYRLTDGSATLGLLTVVPIALVIGLVLAGMYVTDTPVTLLTALLLSLAVGLGVDYNIHISDRFANELDRGDDPVTALRTAVTGTGGALLGSTLTSGGAFATLLLHTSPQLRSFGMLVVLALSLSFLVSVFVFPSMLLLWARRAGHASEVSRGAVAPGDD